MGAPAAVSGRSAARAAPWASTATAPAAATAPVAGVSNAPPFRLPGLHFAAGVVYWLLGAAGLVLIAPELARSAFPLPRVVAVAHLFTLGWITTTILGALYQFLPVALGVPIRSLRTAYLTFWLYVPGLTLFIAGLLTGTSGLTLSGAALFGTGLLIFVGNLAATLKRAPSRTVTWWALAGAAVFLASTVILGVSLAGNLEWNYLGARRMLALGVHMHVAIAGWVMLVIVGVAHRLLPMFLLSHGAPEWPARVSVALLIGGTSLLLALHHALTPAVTWLIGLLLTGGITAFLAQAWLFLRHRKKPSLDPGLRLAAAGLAFLLTALGMAPFFLVRGLAAPGLATAYGVTIVGGALSLFVAGHYYKIFPFLVWYHRFGPWVGKRPVPRVSDLFDPRPANAAVVMLVSGAMALILAPLTGREMLARGGALVYLAGAMIVATQMLMISRRRPE